MAIEDFGDYWTGSEPSDIERYLVEYLQSEQAYAVTSVVPVRCRCGSDRFRLVRALDMTRRACVTCNDVRYICRDGDPIGWDEAVEEDEPDPYRCVHCESDQANVAVGFAGYPENPELVDAVKWFYVGVRCAECGTLDCFNDGKVGRAPAERVYQEVIGNVVTS